MRTLLMTLLTLAAALSPAAFAQPVFNPAVPATIPARNTISNPVATNISSNFSTAMIQPTSTGGFPVGFVVNGSLTGRRTGVVTGGGSPTLTFNPAADFRAGELVTVTLTNSLLGTGSLPLTPDYGYQFRIAGGIGPAEFGGSPKLFGPTTIATAGLAAGDLDGDGDIDLVVGYAYAANRLWFNDGAGNFTMGTDFGNANATTSILLVDLNGDGLLDVVEGNYGAPDYYYLNTGGGVLGSAQVLHPNGVSLPLTYGLKAADFDGDGHMDILRVLFSASGAPAQQPEILLNRLNSPSPPPGGFAAITFGPSADKAQCAEVADFNGDGAPDIILGRNGGIQSATVYLNSGTGTSFTSLTALTAPSTNNATAIVAFDADGDGDMDIVISMGGTVSDQLWINDGSGGFTHVPGAAIGGAVSSNNAAVGDFNGDGDMDVAIAGNGNQSRVWLGAAGATFAATPKDFGSGATKMHTLAVADFNGDGIVDIATTYNDAPTTVQPRVFLNLLPTSAISIAQTSYTVLENQPSVTVTVNRSGATTTSVSVSYATADGTATAGAGLDYTAMAGTLTFGVGITTQTVVIPILNDSLNEGTTDETFFFNISNPTAGNTLGTAQATIHITDDDVPPVVQFASATMNVAEAGPTAQATISLSRAYSSPVTVTWSTNPGTASATLDFIPQIGATLQIPAHSTSGTASVAIVDDTLVEGPESFQIQITQLTAGSLGTPSTITVTIDDNDTYPGVTFPSATDTTAEQTSNHTYTASVSLSHAYNDTVTVLWEALALGTDTATGAASAGPGTDFLLNSGTLTFPANQITPTQQPQVTIVADTLSEAPETFTIRLTLPANPNAQLGTHPTLTVTITDNDPLPVARVTAATAAVTVAENAAAGLASVDVELSEVSGQPVTVTVTFGPGVTNPAAAGDDFTATPVTLTFSPGQTLKTASVAIINDTIDEHDETLVATLTAPSACTLHASFFTSTITILDDDAPPTGGLTSTAFTVNEGAGPAQLTIQLSAQSGKSITFDYATQPSMAPNAATPGVDYTHVSSSVTFAPGETSKTIPVSIFDDFADENDEVFEVALSIPAASTGNITPATMLATVTIIDNDDTGVIAIQNAAYSVAENASPATVTITLTLSVPSPGTVSVGYRTLAGGSPQATAAVDYGPVTSSVLFPLGSQTATFTVTIIDDAIDEHDEQFLVEIFGAANATINPAASQATVTITDDDALPTLTLPSITASAAENAGTVTVTVNLTPASGRTVTLNWATAPLTATGGIAPGPGVDYISASGQLSFAPGDTVKTVTVTITDDTAIEPDETFRIEFTGAVNANAPAPPAHVTVTILDNDSVPAFAFSAPNFTFAETTGNATVTVNLSIAPTQNVTVDFAAVAGTAQSTPPADFTPVSTTLTFTPTGPLSQTVNVPVIGDTIHEGDETVLLTLTNPSAGTSLGTQSSATLTITDNDPAPSIRFLSSNTTVSEGIGLAVITVELSNPSQSTVTVNYATADGSATAPADYAFSSSTLTFNPLETTKTFTVAIVDDLIQESQETVVLLLSSPTVGSLGTPAVATLTISDNDAPLQLSFAQASTQATEDTAGTVSLSVILGSPAGVGGVTATVTVTGGTATSPADFTLLTTGITIPQGSSSALVQVAVNPDTVNEPNETVELTLSGVTGATLGTQATATLTIIDDDPAVTVSFAAATQAYSEAAGTVQVSVSLSQPTTYPVTVLVSSSNGTAAAPGDFTALNSVLVTIPAGNSSASFPLTILADGLDEDDETLTLTLASPTPASATPGATASTTVTILDDDPMPSVAFASATVSAAENAGTISLPVQLGTASGRSVTVSWSAASGGTATPGTDFTAPGGQVTIPAGQTSGAIQIPVIDDTQFEGDETFTIQLSSPLNATLGATASVTVTITDNDPQPTVAFTQPAFEVVEGTAPASSIATVTVTRTGDAQSPVTVAYATADGTAASGTDYFSASGTLTFAPGVFSRSFTVTIIPNAVSDGDRAFTVALSNPTTAALASPSSATVTIRDDEGTPSVAFTQATSTVPENAGTIQLSVSLLFPASQEVTVDFSTVNGTAVAPGDFFATSGTLTFPAGTTTRTISVTIIDDLAIEPDESFTVVLSAPTGATLGPASTATITIQSDDLLPSLNFASGLATVTEGAGTLDLTVTLSQQAAATVTVDYATSPGTALAGVDFSPASGTLTFPPGTTTRTVTVTILDDGVQEPAESFSVTLTNPANAALAVPSAVTVTITDDDTTAPSLPAFQSLTVNRLSRTYTAGDSITVIAHMNSPALTLSADLSALDAAFALPRSFQSFGGGEYRMTSLALNPLTMVDGINLPITVTASPLGSTATVTSTVLVNIDSTPAQGILTFSAPRTAVPAGVLNITLAFDEPIQTTPTISISGIAALAVASAPMAGTPPAHSFTYAWNVPAGTTGQATVTVNGAIDMAGIPATLPAGVQLTVTGGAPILLANAGPDRTLTAIAPVTLDGSGSIGASTYLWDVVAKPQSATVTLTNPTTASPTFTPTRSGAYLFRLTVEAANGTLSAQDIVQIFAPDLPPVVDAGNDFSLDHTDIVPSGANNLAALGLDGRVFDPNGDTIYAEWSLVSQPTGGNVLPLDMSSPATALRVYGSKMVGGVYEFQLRAADPASLNANQWIAATVRLLVISDTVIPPAADAGLNQVVQAGSLVVLDGTASSDPDAVNPLFPQLSFAWTNTAKPEGATVSLAGANTATPGFTPTLAGVYHFSLRVTDPAGFTSSPSQVRIVVIDVTSAPAAHLPIVEINAPAAQPRAGSQTSLGTSVMYALSADAVTVQWTQLQGPEVITTPNGRSLVFTPTLPGRYRFRATPTANGRIGVADEIELPVAAAGFAAPLAVAAVHSSDDADGDGFILFVPGIGVDNLASNPRINLSAAGSSVTGTAAPSYRWRQVSGPTVGITGVTTAEASIAPRVAGVYVFEVGVSDAAGLTGTALVSFAVDTFDPLNNPTFGNSLPRPTVTQPAAITLGAQATVTGTVFDPNDASPGFRWVQISGAPLILASPTAASTTLNPPVSGVYRFALHGTDGKNRGPGGIVTLNVNQPAQPPANPAGGGGGGCVLANSGSTQPLWPAFVLFALAGLAFITRRRAV